MKLTCTMFVITVGSIPKGNLNMLNNDRDTKVVLGSSILFGSESTKVANVTIET